ncbi:dinitrogenase iron-molybdenum cofactor biosynthesis protein [Bacteroidia bacterium]|nr:dinitrogenase iron-molybdenum cofactor biosynthesis protein [Bacteroidia bacterium]
MYRIAIASNNGESVNQHFGQAENFLIYEISDEGEIEFIDDRAVGANNHSPSPQQVADSIADCRAVFVLRIGQQSSRIVRERGITPFEVDFPLHKIFETLKRQQQRGRVKLF